MPIEYSNILMHDTVIQVDPAPGAKPNIQQIATKKKSHDLLRSIDVGNELVMRFMGPKVRSILMQQTFENSDTVCAAIAPDGLVTEYDGDGNVVNETSSDTLQPFVRNAWDQLNPAAGQQKSGLILAVPAWDEHMIHQNGTFKKSLKAVHANVPALELAQ